MKTSIKICSAIFLAGVISMGCNSPAGKVENAKEDIAEKEQELDKAKQAYQTELENFRKESTEKISENERIIADFRAKIAKEKKEVRVVY
jgi:hypothetical protein